MLGSAAVRPRDHDVQFYEDDDDLITTVAARLGLALAGGESAVVLAVATHRAAIAAALRRWHDVDVPAAERSGALVWLDATELAAALIADGALSAAVFQGAVAPHIWHGARGRARVHVFGEVVAVLWADGHVVAALELERLWNDLAAEVPMSVLCGYPSVVTTGRGGGAAYRQICGAHDHVVGVAPVAADAETSRRFPGTTVASRHARRFVVETLRQWGHLHLVDAAALVVSELAANAVRHARSEFTVSLARIGSAVRVTVGDRRAAPPQPRASHPTEPHGRGMLLVAAVSSSWGYATVPGGKLVWAELGADSSNDAG